MANQYFDPPQQAQPGTRALAAQVNSVSEAAGNAFDMLPNPTSAINWIVATASLNGTVLNLADDKIPLPLVPGQWISFIAPNDIGAGVTITVNSGGTQYELTGPRGVTLGSTPIPSGEPVSVTFTGVRFEVQVGLGTIFAGVRVIPTQWQPGTAVTSPSDYRSFTDGTIWTAPAASESSPVLMGTTPVGDSAWQPLVATSQTQLAAPGGAQLVGNSARELGTLSALLSADWVEVGSTYHLLKRDPSNPDGHPSEWLCVNTADVTPNGFDIVTSTDDPAKSFRLISAAGNILHYGGAIGTTESGPAANAAIAHVNIFFIPQGVTVYATEIAMKDDTFFRDRGRLLMTPNSAEWARVLTNEDRVNGNQNFTIDARNGELNGNSENQGMVTQHFAYFRKCRGVEMFGGKWGNNSAPDENVHTPVNHPEGPFDDGVIYGEPQATNPTIAFAAFTGGNNNHVRDFKLIDWQQEGISHRWSEGSSIDNFIAINGPEPTTESVRYAPVDHTTRSGTVTLAVGDNVEVMEGHTVSGQEQQPYLIYRSLVSGSVDLGAEDYTDAARWTLVLRDISGDLGYTAARCGGGQAQLNRISNGTAYFCRASSFSNDSQIAGMANLLSYHNSFQPGMNFGHANTPTTGSYMNGCISINAGWSGGTGGNSYGINFVASSEDVVLNGFYVCGAGRNGLNVSDGADRIKAMNGLVKFSAAAGIRASSAELHLTAVTSRDNVGADYEPAGTAVISLDNCYDSRGVLLTNERLIQTARSGQNQQTPHVGDGGKVRRVHRDTFATSAGVPLVTLTGQNVNSDMLRVRVEYGERNAGSSAIGNQFSAAAIIVVAGSGSVRNLQVQSNEWMLNRRFRATWTATGNGMLEIYLQDGSSTDVAAAASNNYVYAEIINDGWDYEVGLG